MWMPFFRAASGPFRAMRVATLLAVLVAPRLCAAADELLYIGTQSGQLTALWFNADTGKLLQIGPVAQGLHPTWTVAHPRLPVLYAVDETREGSATAFAINRSTGALSKINSVPASGSGTAFLSLDLPSATLLAANYGSGSASTMPIRDDGGLGAPVSTLQDTGNGPSPRQAGPHAHAVLVAPGGQYALVADLGNDRVLIHRFDQASHRLLADDASMPPALALPPGSGPRHLALGRDGRYAYLVTELTSQLLALRWDAAQGSLTLMQSLPVNSAQFTGVRSGAEVAVSADGRYVYASDRNENTLVTYRVDTTTGLLTWVGRTSSGGEVPWSFALHPSGKWLLVANQRSGTVNVFRIDPSSGALSDSGISQTVPTPVSITILPQPPSGP